MLQRTTGTDPVQPLDALFGVGGFAMSGVVSGDRGGRPRGYTVFERCAIFRPTMDTQSCANVVKTELSRQRCECRRNRLDVDEG